MLPSMRYGIKKIPPFHKAIYLLCMIIFADNVAATGNGVQDICVPIGYWVAPGENRNKTLDMAEFMTALSKQAVVLLGESHDNAEHHRWQLQTIAGIYAQRPDMVMGFEMFPRRVQGVLDRWVAGNLTEGQFLAESDWDKVWNFDAGFYLPLFHFARMNRIPMLALNVDRSLTATVSEQGWGNVAENSREGVTQPAPASKAYLEELAAVFQAHSPPKKTDSASTTEEEFDFDNPRFRRFVDGQLTWDRAMAQIISSAAQKTSPPMIVGIMGAGHIKNRYGIPHQLKDLGIAESTVLLPWDRSQDCEELVPDLADAVFGVNSPTEPETDKPRLGLLLEDTEKGVQVIQVIEGSVAETTGIREQDILLEIAGHNVANKDGVIAAVQSQTPDSRMPLKIKRGAQTLELTAKFPASK
jgi:uncharacterized iron-regulated protein